jgi:threonine/homoserine/homoserine lactone efflux protein
MEPLYFLAKGTGLGITAGISPGPLTILVISHYLRFGRTEALKVAIAPLITDIPILLICYLLLQSVGYSHLWIGTVSFLGAWFLARMGISHLRYEAPQISLSAPEVPASIRKGVMSNLLNPAPYLFWLGVGTPNLAAAVNGNRLSPALFVAGMLSAMVITKFALGWVVHASSSFLSSDAFPKLVKVSGVMLLGFAANFAWSGALLIIRGSP